MWLGWDRGQGPTREHSCTLQWLLARMSSFQGFMQLTGPYLTVLGVLIGRTSVLIGRCLSRSIG